MSKLWRLFVLGAAVFFLVACGSNEPEVLRLATTTSTEDSGLLQAILPNFEESYDARVDVVAVGTGQAIALGEAGDADVILVHARSREDAFVADGHGRERFEVMYNDFIIVGPTDDPAGIQGMELAVDALTAIAESESTWASRGDDSGTHSKERSLWETAGFSSEPEGDWYNSLGQGMGDTLRYANETGAYTITDRGTYLSQQDNLPNLAIMVGGSSIDENDDLSLYNPYGVSPVRPVRSNGEVDLANDFVEWLTSIETQSVIAEYGIDIYGQPLFYPNSQAWRDH